MYNITFNDNKVFKIYDSSENVSEGILTLHFQPEDYSFDIVKAYFSIASVDSLKRIVKTASDASYIGTYNNYSSVQGISLDKVTVNVSKSEEIPTLDESGKETTTTIDSTEEKQIDLVTVTLGYVNPIEATVKKLDGQINPTIDIKTCTLDDLKKHRQSKNKEAMNDFFRNNPMKFTDGLYYGVEDEDRSEMTEEYLGYSMEKTINSNAKLEWHSKGSACTERTEEEFAAIAIAIREYTKPYFNKMQKAKEEIFAAKDKDAVMAVKIFGQE